MLRRLGAEGSNYPLLSFFDISFPQLEEKSAGKVLGAMKRPLQRCFFRKVTQAIGLLHSDQQRFSSDLSLGVVRTASGFAAGRTFQCLALSNIHESDLRYLRWGRKVEFGTRVLHVEQVFPMSLTLTHIILQCESNPKFPPLRSLFPTPELCEYLVTSGHLDVQQLLACRAKAFCSSHGFSD